MLLPRVWLDNAIRLSCGFIFWRALAVVKKLTPLARLQRLIEVKQRDVKSSQLRLHKKKLDLDQQLKRLTMYREEYVKVLMASNIAPLQMHDTKRFLQQLETSIEDTKLALNSQSESEEALQSVAITLKSQQEAVERRIVVAAHTAQSLEDLSVASVSNNSPYSRDSKSR